MPYMFYWYPKLHGFCLKWRYADYGFLENLPRGPVAGPDSEEAADTEAAPAGVAAPATAAAAQSTTAAEAAAAAAAAGAAAAAPQPRNV